MVIRVPVTIALLIGLGVIGCQQPIDGGEPGDPDIPSGPAASTGSPAPGSGSTPIAPAIEPSHPDAERTIELPESFEPPGSTQPIAPAVELEPAGPDPTIEVDPD